VQRKIHRWFPDFSPGVTGETGLPKGKITGRGISFRKFWLGINGVTGIASRFSPDISVMGQKKDGRRHRRIGLLADDGTPSFF
jgi:hypothetical protein